MRVSGLIELILHAFNSITTTVLFVIILVISVFSRPELRLYLITHSLPGHDDQFRTTVTPPKFHHLSSLSLSEANGQVLLGCLLLRRSCRQAPLLLPGLPHYSLVDHRRRQRRQVVGLEGRHVHQRNIGHLRRPVCPLCLPDGPCPAAMATIGMKVALLGLDGPEDLDLACLCMSALFLMLCIPLSYTAQLFLQPVLSTIYPSKCKIIFERVSMSSERLLTHRLSVAIAALLNIFLHFDKHTKRPAGRRGG